MRIYTKTGDQGETSLFGGMRVPKDNIRVAAYGMVDELGALLGWARSLAVPSGEADLGATGDLVKPLQAIQSLLFELGADLATPPERRSNPRGQGRAPARAADGGTGDQPPPGEDREAPGERADAAPKAGRYEPQGVLPADIAWLEEHIDAAEGELPPLKSFVLSGGCPLAAALHVARTACRRTERAVVALQRAEPEVSEQAVIYLNRLSDFLFVWARLANKRAGVADIPWQAR
jgi:cob(I)alamin adenosyltransferase